MMSDSGLVFLLLLFLCLGSFFALLREAFSLTGRAGVKRLVERYPSSAGRLTRALSRWSLHVISLSIAALCCMLGLLAAALALAGDRLEGVWILAAALVFAFLLAFLVDILPRALAESYADRFSFLFIVPVAWLTYILWPLSWVLSVAQKHLRKAFLSGADEEDHPSSEDNIRSLVSDPTGTDLEESEREIIRSVFEFGETVAREIMTPRVDIQALEGSRTVAEAVLDILESPYSRFPVIHENMDDIQGAVHVKDLLHELSAGRDTGHVLTLAKPVPFVPEAMPINDLLQLLRAEQSQLTIVVDEYGGTSGLVSVEDIIEELVGEIQDEYDPDQVDFRPLSDGSVLLPARVSVDETNERLRINIPTDPAYDSLGGYVIHHLGRIPRPGETLSGPDFRMTVQSANPRRIHTLRVYRSTPQPAGQAS